MKAEITQVVPKGTYSWVFPVCRARLNDLNSFVSTVDGTMYRVLYCTPTYVENGYVEKPVYA